MRPSSNIRPTGILKRIAHSTLGPTGCVLRRLCGALTKVDPPYTMVVLIDYHTEEHANEIAPEDWLALIAIGEPGQRHKLLPGWKRLLALEFAESSVAGTQQRLTASHAEQIGQFWDGLVDERTPLALAIRCDPGRRRSAAVARALAGTGGIRLALPKSEYEEEVYETLRAHLETRPRLSVKQRARIAAGP